MADDLRKEVTLERDAHFFSVSANSFAVGGPNIDGTMQIFFMEDFGDLKKMVLVGAAIAGAPEGVYAAGTPEFEADGVRVLLGRVKMNMLAAQQLRDALSSQIERVQAATTITPQG